MDAAFRAAEAHGIRAILGKVMMDRGTYDPIIEPSTILDRSLRESADLIERWHGARRRPARLRGHAALRDLVQRRHAARIGGARRARPAPGGRPTSREDPFEIAEVGAPLPGRPRLRRRLRPRRRARRAGPSWPTPSTSRTASSAAWSRPGRTSRTARPRTCSSGPASCRSRATSRPGCRSGSGRTCPAARMRRSSRSCGSAPTRRWRAGRSPATRAPSSTRSTGCGWARSTARGRSGSDDVIGSLEAGKEADLIAVDPAFAAPLPGSRPTTTRPTSLSRLIFRAHPDMVRAAWVRGRRLAGRRRVGRLLEWGVEGCAPKVHQCESPMVAPASRSCGRRGRTVGYGRAMTEHADLLIAGGTDRRRHRRARAGRARSPWSTAGSACSRPARPAAGARRPDDRRDRQGRRARASSTCTATAAW